MTTLESVRRLSRYDALLLTALLWFLAKFVRYAFPPVFDSISASYGVSNAELGAAYTALMLAYAAMQFPSGMFADRIGAVRVIVGGAVIAAAGALSVAVELPFLALVGAMVVMGIGTGFHKTVAVPLLSTVYPDRTGRALGVLDTLGTFSGVVAPVAAVALVGVAWPGGGWRLLFLGAGAAGIALAAAFLLRVPRRLPDGEGAAAAGSGGIELRGYVTLFSDPRFTAFVAMTILFAFTYNGLVAFLPLYLTDEAGLASATASLLYSALFAASFVQLVTGEASDRVGPLTVIGATVGIATVSLVALVLLSGTGNPWLLGAAAVGVGIGSHGYRPVRGAYLMSLVPERVAGGSIGVVRTLLMTAGAVSPAIVGYISETAGFRPAFWVLAGALVLSVGLVAVLAVTGD